MFPEDIYPKIGPANLSLYFATYFLLLDTPIDVPIIVMTIHKLKSFEYFYFMAIICGSEKIVLLFTNCFITDHKQITEWEYWG